MSQSGSQIFSTVRTCQRNARGPYTRSTICEKLPESSKPRKSDRRKSLLSALMAEQLGMMPGNAENAINVQTPETFYNAQISFSVPSHGNESHRNVRNARKLGTADGHITQVTSQKSVNEDIDEQRH